MSKRYAIVPYQLIHMDLFRRNPLWFMLYLELIELAIYSGPMVYPGPNRKWVLQTGQLATSVGQLVRRWHHYGLSTQNIRTFLDNLEYHNLITKETNKGGTLITICNYSEWHQPKNKKSQTKQSTSNNHFHNVNNQYKDIQGNIYPENIQTHYNGSKMSPEMQEIMKVYHTNRKKLKYE